MRKFRKETKPPAGVTIYRVPLKMKVDIFNTDKKYQVIYADPPWSYRDKRNKHKRLCGGALSHYQTMNIEEIKSLPVSSISDENCILFIWVTFPNLQEGLDTIRAWGFKYKTLGFSWIKTNRNNGRPFFGIGYYTKSNCEICLIGVKGKPFKASNSVSSVVIAPREKHSKKPDIVRQNIEKFVGEGYNMIELFARQSAKRWDCWGLEAPDD